MHPAYSVIVFTTLSGTGYGLLFWLGLYALAGLLPADPLFGAVAMALALGAVTVGLLSSTLHLGHPERAWRSFSQWRSSWLSREGVASVFTYIPALALGVGWIVLANSDGIAAASGLLTAVGAAVTVLCTAWIYRSLKPIPRWHNRWVAPNYLALSAMTGALVLAPVAQLFGHRLPGAPALVLATIVVAFALKIAYWHFIDYDLPASTPETATGLGALGKVRLFEAPHIAENYLLKEMGYRIARKHAHKLRMIALACGFVLPFVLSLLADATAGVIGTILSLAAAAIAMPGVLIERWLFFAEAKHTVTLYYGRSVAP